MVVTQYIVAIAIIVITRRAGQVMIDNESLG